MSLSPKSHRGRMNMEISMKPVQLQMAQHINSDPTTTRPQLGEGEWAIKPTPNCELAGYRKSTLWTRSQEGGSNQRRLSNAMLTIRVHISSPSYLFRKMATAHYLVISDPVTIDSSFVVALFLTKHTWFPSFCSSPSQTCRTKQQSYHVPVIWTNSSSLKKSGILLS